MKKFKIIFTLFIFFSIACLFSGPSFGYDEGNRIHMLIESNGTASDPIRIYQLVRFPDLGNSHLYVSAGDVLIWDTVSEDGVSANYVQFTDITTSSDCVAGVAVGDIPTADSAGTVTSDVGKRNWGYIQVYGYNEKVKVDASAITAGEGLRASAQKGQATGTSGDATTNGGGSLGFAYNANSSTSTSIKVFIRCM